MTKRHRALLGIGIGALALSSVLAALRGDYIDAGLRAVLCLSLGLSAATVIRTNSAFIQSRRSHVLLYLFVALALASLLLNFRFLVE